MITVMFSAADINHLLAEAPDVTVRYLGGRFTIDANIPKVPGTVHALAIPDLGQGRVRFAIPLREVGGTGLGRLAGPLVRMLHRRLEQRLESLLADELAKRGLPWDLLWLDHFSDEQLGPVMTVNLSPYTLNQFVAKQTEGLPVTPRLSGIGVYDHGIELRFQLADRNSPDHAARPGDSR